MQHLHALCLLRSRSCERATRVPTLLPHISFSLLSKCTSICPRRPPLPSYRCSHSPYLRLHSPLFGPYSVWRYSQCSTFGHILLYPFCFPAVFSRFPLLYLYPYISV